MYAVILSAVPGGGEVESLQLLGAVFSPNTLKPIFGIPS